MRMALLIRAAVTLGCVPLAYWGTQVFSCRRVSISWPADLSTIGSCSESASGGVSGLMAAAGLLVSVLLILTVTWLPVVIRRRSNRNRVMSSLGENLKRAVPESKIELEDHDLPQRDHSAIRAAAVKAMEVEPQTRQSSRSTVDTLPQPPAQSPPSEPNGGGELRRTISGLKVRVDMIEEALDTDTLSPKEAMQQWVGLLKDCNDAHNSGRLPSSVFKDLNTRLLDLFTTPSTHDEHSP